MILQNLCFCHIEFNSEPPDRRFDRALWGKKGALTYWKTSPEGVLQNGSALELACGRMVSSDTFFNAFFLGHWRKLTSLQTLSLQLKFRGKFTLEIFTHTSLGEGLSLACIELGRQDDGELVFDFAGEHLATGLRLSFALTSREDGSQLLGGAWRTNDLPVNPVRLSIGITTYNRPVFAQRLVQNLLANPVLQREGIRIELVDQSEVSQLEHLGGDRCRVTRQKNLGGSGGFSRAIYESLFIEEKEKPTHVLLMDDDIELEMDSVLRAIRMMQLAKSPFILGGIQLDLYSPTLACGMGETFKKDANGNYDGFYSLKKNLTDADVSLPNDLNAVSIPYASDYCGWWFCVIPVELILKMGLPIPFFIKGDDLEYGLRAGAEDCPSHMIAGIGLWHPPPYSKSAAWIRYLDIYNHLILNSLRDYPEFLNLFQMQATWALGEITRHRYQIAVAMLRGMEDFLGGWEFYKKRTFPEYLLEVKKEVAAYEANDRGLPVIREDQSHALTERLTAVISRVRQEGQKAQAGMKSNLPKTTNRQAWEYYFENGNHAQLPA